MVRPFARVVCLAIVMVLTTGTALADRKSRRTDDFDAPYRNKPIVEGAAVWHCWYGRDTNAYCQLGDAGTHANAAESVAPRLPALVETIVNAPAELSSRTVRIPLHAIPYNHEMVGMLAESVMCGRRGQAVCGIIYGETREKLAALVAQRELAKVQQLQADRVAAAMVN